MSSINTIITIGRQFGSGGREIGKRLAEEFGIPFYDKEILSRAAEESGLCKELFETHDEKQTNSFLYSLVMDTYSMGFPSSASFTDMPLNHKIFLAQFETIKKIAEEGPCVIVGRCADYTLESRDNVLSVFIHADENSRIRRIAKDFDLSDAKAKDLIHKTDKKRSSYYNYYTNKKWSDATSYHFSICSSQLGIDGTVEMIKELVKKKESIGKVKIW